jgi:hypothetical protein
VVRHLPHRGGDFLPHLIGEGVEHLGTIQRDRADAILNADEDVLVRQVRPSFPKCRGRLPAGPPRGKAPGPSLSLPAIPTRRTLLGTLSFGGESLLIRRVRLRSPALALASLSLLVSSGDLAAQTSRWFPGWNLGYDLPATWYVRQTPGRMHVLSSNSEPGALFVAPGLYASLEDVNADLDAFAQLAGLVGREVDGPVDTTIAGLRAIVASYAGVGRSNQTVKARMAALFTPHGTGFVVLGMASTEQFWFITEKVHELASSVSALPPEIDDGSVEALQGTWANYLAGRPPQQDTAADWTRGIRDLFQFDVSGDFSWKSSAFLAAESRGAADDPALLRDQLEEGTYTVISGGTLVLKSPQGQRAVPFTLEGDRLSLSGRTYFRRR